MAMRELLPFGRSLSVPVLRGASPILEFQDEMNKMFNDFFGEMAGPSLWRGAESLPGLTPAVDVVEGEKDYRIEAEVPGMDIKDVHITVSDGYVTLKGEKKSEKEDKGEGYYRRERSYGEFQRVLAMPDTADLDKAEARISNGVLTVTIPRKAGAQSKERKLEIKKAA